MINELLLIIIMKRSLNPRLLWADSLKGWLMLLVILGHAIQTVMPEACYQSHIWNLIYSFPMPAFMAVSDSQAKHIVVATHHVPSFQLVSPDFKGSPINGAFTAELGNFIAYSRIDYWIYGHSHRNIDRIIGNTQCVSNQLGYVNHGESESFDSKKCINLML